MRREDFKEISETHISTAKKIKEQSNCDGNDIRCRECPFTHRNTENYKCMNLDDEDLKNVAIEFVKTFGGNE